MILKENSEGTKVVITKDKRKNVITPLKDIIYIEAMEDYIILYTEKSRHIHKLALKKAVAILENESFPQIHKSYLVNEAKVVEIATRRAIVKRGEERVRLPLGSNYKEKFKAQMFKTYNLV